MTLANFTGEADLTLFDLLTKQAKERPELPAYTFLDEGDCERSISYDELDRSARAIAARLQQAARPGDRALLVFPPGLDFISAFCGCAYAGVLAVPIPYARPNSSTSRMVTIAKDCDAKLALTSGQTLRSLVQRDVCLELAAVQWMAVDEVPTALAQEWQPPSFVPRDLAFLQYTSGSTSIPKGVMVSHQNLMHNLETIRQGFGLPMPPPGETASIGVSWLPAYHDMGLIGGILGSMYVRGRGILFSPTSFLRRPIRWLETISRFGATVSGAPNFAYDLCTERVSTEEMAGLDLSRWRVAFCGAEPIHSETLRRFAETFAPCGFRADSFYCCYGLAEATLLVAGGRGPAAPRVQGFERTALSNRRVVVRQDLNATDVQPLVGCGSSLGDQRIVIVDPHTLTPADADQMGEIWVQGPHVSRGYWNRDTENDSAFGARLADDAGGRYLRTGDLGFFVGDELFVAGRLKDLIVIRGRNHYPHDLERTAAASHRALLSGGGAAFAISADGRESLVILHEVDRRLTADMDEVIRSIRREVTAEHEVDVFAVVLIRRGSLPRTSSGKVRRYLCRERYLQDALKVIAEWSRQATAVRRSIDTAGTAAAATRQDQPDANPPNEGRRWRLATLLPPNFEPGSRRLSDLEVKRLTMRIEAALLEWLSRQEGTSAGSVDPQRSFAEYGVDSLAAVDLIEQLQESLRVRLTPVMAWNYPTPSSMAAFLARRVADPDANEEAEEPKAAGIPNVEQLLNDVEGLSDEEAMAALQGSNGHHPSQKQDDATPEETMNRQRSPSESAPHADIRLRTSAAELRRAASSSR